MLENNDNHKKQALLVLQEHWGYQDFRDGQWEAISLALNKRDTLVIFPTGGGKSLCYQIPAALNEGLTLVVSPLIALMQDQVAGLRARNISATFINSTLSQREIDQRLTDAEHGRYKLLYLAPERLESRMFQARAERLGVELLAVDEAHCISEWGLHFRPSYRRIADARARLGSPPIIAVTATATPEVRHDILTQLNLIEPKILVYGFDRPNITWSIFETDNKRAKLLEIIRAVEGSGLVYAGSRKATEDWAIWLNKEGLDAEAYHAGLSSGIRAQVAQRWIDGETEIVVATNAFGMGIDKPDVRFVVHVDLPMSLEAYYQEAGRGGRDGKRSFAVLLFRESDAALPQGLIAESHPELRVIREVYSAVASVAQIPLGGVFEEPIMLDHDTISSQVGCSRAMVRASVDQLVRQEIWERLPGGVSRGFVRMNMTTADVRHYIHSLQNRHLAEFVDLLMRRLSAEVFFEWIDIDLALLGRDIGMPVERISDGLHFLAGQDVLSYRAPDDGERIRFLEPRTRLVSLAGKAMSRSRKRSTSKFRHMLRYARSRTCRRHLLLGYFGERASVPCGACDVCLGRHQTPVITSSDEADLIALLKAIDTGAEGEDGNSGHVVRSVREESLLAWLVQEGYVEYPDLFEERPEITEKAREWLQQRPGKS